MRNIVILDNDKHLSESYCTVFSDNGFNVVCAHDGKSGFNIIEKQKIDIVLLDVLLPLVDGFEVLRKIRKSKDLNGTKVFVLTDLCHQDDVRMCMDLGACSVDSKSNCGPNEIVKKIQDYIAKS
jgi:DNA-binding response OmpR family regulator